MGNTPLVARVGGVRWSLGLGWWGHRWRVVGGRANGWGTGGSAGCCLRGEARRRRSGWGLGLFLGLLGQAGREGERGRTDQYVSSNLTSALVMLDVWLCEWLLTKTVLGAGVGPAAGVAGVL